MSCFLNKRCILGDVLNQETVAPTDNIQQNKVYCGICETALKRRYENHRGSFNLDQYRRDKKFSNKFLEVQCKKQKFNCNMGNFRITVLTT